MADDPIKEEKPRFHITFLQAVKDAILRRPVIRFSSEFSIKEADGEIHVSLAQTGPKKDSKED